MAGSPALSAGRVTEDAEKACRQERLSPFFPPTC